MPDATITSTASTFGTITGTFAADQSTVTGTVTGIITGTLSGSVGVPGPAGAPGVGVPAGGTAGQFLTKIDGTNYNTDWTTVNLTGLATESWVTAGFYPLTGNPSGFLTAAPVTSVAGRTGAITLSNTDISGLGTLAVVNDAPSDGSQYARKNGAWDVVATAPDFISSVSSPLAVTTGNLTIDLSAYAPLASPAFTGTPTAPTPSPGTDSTRIATTEWVKDLDYAPLNSPQFNGNPRGPTPSLSDDDTSLATTEFVKGQNYITSSALTGYATESWVTAGFYPLTGNPSSFLVAADIAGLAPLASPALTGNVTITSNSAGAALFIEQAGTGNILTLHDQASDTTFVAIDQNGKVNTIPSVTASAGFNVPHGAAPTTPVNGDIWTTTGGLFMRQNGTTQQYVDFGGTQTISGVKTFSNANLTLGNSTGNGTINVGTGAVISGSTKAVNIGTNGVAGSTTNITVGPALGASTTTIGATTAASTLNLATGSLSSGLTKAINIGTGSVSGSTTTIAIGSNFGTSTTITGTLTATGQDVTLGNSSAASTINVGTGATFTATTKTVNIGTSGSAGSTTNIAIGSTTGTSTTTLQGITNGVTQTAGDSSLKLATTAFVTTANNLKANLASPALTGVPTAPTATLGTNTTQIATTAFVLANAPAAPVTSVAGRTGAVVLSVADVSGAAPLASPALTGTPTAPTATAGTNTTQLATTAFVQQEVPAASTTAAGKVELATLAEIITGTDTGRVMPVSQIPVTTASPYLRSLAAANYTSVSGSGAVTGASGQQFSREAYLTSSAAGRAAFGLGIAGLANGQPSFHTANFGQINFSNKIILSGTTVFGISGYAGNANTCIYVTIGGYSSAATGAMTQKGIGIKKVGGTSNVIELIVHNGTSQTAVSTSTAPALAEAVNWTIYSDGTGNVTLYINGSQAATTSAGPTGTNTAGNSAYREQVECPSGSGATHSIHSVGGWVYIRP